MYFVDPRKDHDGSTTKKKKKQIQMLQLSHVSICVNVYISVNLHGMQENMTKGQSQMG